MSMFYASDQFSYEKIKSAFSNAALSRIVPSIVSRDERQTKMLWLQMITPYERRSKYCPSTSTRLIYGSRNDDDTV